MLYSFGLLVTFKSLGISIWICHVNQRDLFVSACVFFFPFFPNKSMQEDLLGDSLPVKDLTNGFTKLISRAALSHLESDDLFWLGQKCQILKNRDVTKLYYC